MTQAQKIRQYLDQGNGLSSLHASTAMGITQLSSRLGELEKNGYLLSRRWIHYRDKETGTRRKYMEYRKA